MALRTTMMTSRQTAAITFLALLCSAVQSPPLLEARPQGDKALCKKVQQAVRAGRTPEQIMADFQVDARQLMKCLQKKGKKKATKPSKVKRSGSRVAPQPHIAKGGEPATHAVR